ncbi:MAG TPA: TIGR03545 family protein [Gemmatimonadales bacterium]|nr:TIGR03545 family protein [Gemmatimonadales bacterium]
MSDRFKIFRWRAVGPLLLFLLLLVVLWVLFADTLARRETVANLSELLGTEVDLAGLRIRESDAAVDLTGLAIADPRDSMRNLIEAGGITVDLDPIPLTEKKIVIDQLKLSGLRFLTRRERPARPADPNSPAGRLLQQTEAWARDKFQFPALALGRVDTVKSVVLQPAQLQSVQAAQALTGRADSTRRSLEQGLATLDLQPLLDSTTALAGRLARLDPKQAGLAGIKDAVTSAQQGVDQLKQARGRLQALEQTAHTSMSNLQAGLADLDAARQRDYAFARGLLNLPSFAGPDIGQSLFGRHSVDYFQQALYYAKLLQRYVPPGLQPWNRPGPKRVRMDGTNVEFPQEAQYPRFLLKQADLDLALGDSARNSFTAKLANITSQPALYGRPATLEASGRLGGATPVTVSLNGLMRAFGPAPKDSVVARVQGVTLPSFKLPGLGFSVAPGRSTVGFGFTLAGDRLAGSWELSTGEARWQADSSRLQSGSLVQTTIWRVVSGLSELRVRADLGGTVTAPTLKVSSNLDDAIAARLKGIAGEELAKAEAKARAAVDRLVNDQVTALQGRVSALQSQVVDRLPVERGKLDQAQQQLEAQVKRLAGPAGGILKLPKL